MLGYWGKRSCYEFEEGAEGGLKLQLNSLPIKNLQEGSFVESSSLMPLITRGVLLWFWVISANLFADVFFVFLHSCVVLILNKGQGTAGLGFRLSDKFPELESCSLFVLLHFHDLHAFLQNSADSKDEYSERPYSSNMDQRNKRLVISFSIDKFPRWGQPANLFWMGSQTARLGQKKVDKTINTCCHRKMHKTNLITFSRRDLYSLAPKSMAAFHLRCYSEGREIEDNGIQR